MEKVIEKFNVEYLQILNENGVCDDTLRPVIVPSVLKKIYFLMVLTRAFDDKALVLQRQGRIGTYAPVKGEEACQVASAILMQENDCAFPAFREHGVFLTRGMPPKMLFQYWGGDERGMKIPHNVNVFPVSIPVGTHMLHATGMAMGFALLKKKQVAITYFSEGATSEGDFHEAMNFAGEFKAPVVFICQNNQYAISTPVSTQTASHTIAQKAIAYGFEGIRVDGNDVLAVYKATQDAMKRAREGKGPTFIECYTYRLRDHTTSDDSKKYRTTEEVQLWEKKEPLRRIELYLLNKKILSKSEVTLLREKAKTLIENAVKKYETIKPEAIDEIFNYMYAEIPDELKEQREQTKTEGI